MIRLYTDYSTRYSHAFQRPPSGEEGVRQTRYDQILQITQQGILMSSEDLYQERKGRDSGDTQESKYQQNMTDMGR